MTGKELIKELQKLGDKALEKDVIMFDCGHSYTPYRVKIMDEDGWSKYNKGKILID
jgi:hypothetical protein